METRRVWMFIAKSCLRASAASATSLPVATKVTSTEDWTVRGFEHDVAALFHVIDIDLIAFNERKVLTAENQGGWTVLPGNCAGQAVSVSQASAGRQTSMFGMMRRLSVCSIG